MKKLETPLLKSAAERDADRREATRVREQKEREATFLAAFLEQNPGASTSDAESAWGAAERGSQLEL